MNELQIFHHPELGELEILIVGGEPKFPATESATMLCYSNPRDAIIKHCKGVATYDAPTAGGTQKKNYISEGDLYRLIVKAADQSKSPAVREKAERVEYWIFEELLPTIRKHGAYITPDTLDQMIASPDFGIRLLEALKEEQIKNVALKAENLLMQPKADYFDELVDRNLLTSLRDTAKEFGLKPKAFNQYLLDHRYIYRNPKGELRPYAQHVSGGLFELKESYNPVNGWAGPQTMVTPKGRETFRLLTKRLAG